MKFSELKKYLAENPADNFYLAEGGDAFLRENAADMIIKKTVTGLPDLNVTRLESPDANQVIKSCFVMPFLSEKRVVLISEYYPKASDCEILSGYGFTNPYCVLIVSNSQVGEISKRLSKYINLIDCAREDAAVVEKWITAMVRGKGKSIEPSAAALLALYCARDMSKIDSEIKKLTLACENITAKDVAENVSKDSEYKIYMLANAVASKNGNAYEIINDFALKGESNYVQQLLISLYSQFKRMFFIKDSGISQNGLSQYLGIKPYAVQMSAKSGRFYSKKQLMLAAKLCAETDFLIKSGKMAAGTALYYAAASLMK